ncbi:MAG: M15 family metallopeptidase [Arcobacteraceae bacterium]|nr:M15 family metallopeptidase [Arcobacteraceae bacterium]
MNRRNFLTFTALTPLFARDLMAVEDNINLNNEITNSVYLPQKEWNTLVMLRNRIRALKKYVGFANFNILSFNDSLFYARNYSAIGKFTKDELTLIDKLFYEDPQEYGFYGIKTCFNLNNKISKKDIKKIPRTGHYLFRGKPLEDYKRLKQDVGSSLILTSGIRNTMKQLSLYCDKIYKHKGNITRASTSIAPPAYSYHTTSDFDVGRKGWGHKNFTAQFAQTKEFRKIRKLNYISMRYTINNQDGVRYEPWHIKVI